MSSAILPGVAAAVASVLTGLLSLARLRIRVRAERDRWAAVERLAHSHGSQILAVLPRLARELRDVGTSRPWPWFRRPRRRLADPRNPR